MPQALKNNSLGSVFIGRMKIEVLAKECLV